MGGGVHVAKPNRLRRRSAGTADSDVSEASETRACVGDVSVCSGRVWNYPRPGVVLGEDQHRRPSVLEVVVVDPRSAAPGREETK